MTRIAKKTKKISIYLTNKQYEEMFWRAENVGIGLSAMISIAIAEYIQNNEVYRPNEEDMKQMKLQEFIRPV